MYLDLLLSCCQKKREKYFALPSWSNRLSIRGSGKVSALVTEFRTRVGAKSHRTVLLSDQNYWVFPRTVRWLNDSFLNFLQLPGHFLAGGKWHPTCRLTLRFGVTSNYLHLNTVSFTMLTFFPTGMNCDEGVQTASILPWHTGALILAKYLFSGTCALHRYVPL